VKNFESGAHNRQKKRLWQRQLEAQRGSILSRTSPLKYVTTFVERSVHRSDSSETEFSGNLLSDPTAGLTEKLATAKIYIYI